MRGTDFHAVINRRISVTPIHLDVTGRRLLKRLRTWDWTLPVKTPEPEAAEPEAAEPEAAGTVEARAADTEAP